MTHYVLDACALVAILKGTYHRLSLADAIGIATAI